MPVDCEITWESLDAETPAQCETTPFTRARIFSVTSSPVYLELFGLECDQKVCVSRMTGCEGGDMFIKYRCGKDQVCFTAERESYLFVIPGRYKLSIEGTDTCTVDDGNIQIRQTVVPPDMAAIYQQQDCCCKAA